MMENTKGEGEHSGEKFWTDAERLYYCALIGYLWHTLASDTGQLVAWGIQPVPPYRRVLCMRTARRNRVQNSLNAGTYPMS